MNKTKPLKIFWIFFRMNTSAENLRVYEDNLDVRALTVFVQKVFQEIRNSVECYVATNNNMSNKYQTLSLSLNHLNKMFIV